MVYRYDEESDAEAGLTTYTPPPAGGAYTNPGGVVQLSSAPGAAMAPSGTTGTTYVPGAVYAPPTAVSVSATPTPAYGRGAVAGETLFGSKSVSYRMPVNAWQPEGALIPGQQPDPRKIVGLQLSTIDETRSEILTMDESKLRELQKQFGVKPTGFADPDTKAVVTDFLGYVSEINADGVQLTWREVLNKLTNDGERTLMESPGYGSGSDEPFSGSKTTTSSNVQTLSPSETRSAAEQTFAAVLGRAPTRAERIALRATLNDMAHENPVVTKTTTKYDEGEAVSSHSVTDGGVDIGQKILNEARSKEGYAEYQAINYFNTLESMLAAPGGA